MSDREELRSILFGSDDSGADAGPLDGERAAVDAADVAEADEDETNDLSPEELVAESVRQTNAELGIAEPETAEADSEDDAAEDDADVAALKDKARQWDEYQARQAEQAVEDQRQAIIGEARQNEQNRETRKQQYREFYRNEELRLLAQVDADAEQAPNPEAYRRTHRQSALDACRRAEDLKLREVDLEFNQHYDALNARFEAIDQEVRLARQKPAYADYLISHPELNLPADDPEIRAEILRAAGNLTGESALGAMTVRAREIAWMVGRLRTASQNLDQAAREVKAREVKHSQPHPATATNAPRRAKPVKYAESGPKRKQELASILALPS